MKLARFWTRAQGQAIGRDGQSIRTVARGWSNDSMDAARACARELADRVAARVAAGLPERRQYEYGERPLPEPVIQSFAGLNGGQEAVVTRNAYGALVLNAERLMFVDVDRKTGPLDAGRKRGLLSSLFGKPAPPAPGGPDPVVEGLRTVAGRRGLSARVYETAAGYRLAITNVLFEAESAETEAVLKEFGSDPLYIRLCRQQGSFRARLTPKPWRAGYYRLMVRFPFEPGEESRHQRWEDAYNSHCASLATCRYVTAFGPAITAPGFDELLRYHDRETKASSGLPLA